MSTKSSVFYKHYEDANGLTECEVHCFYEPGVHLPASGYYLSVRIPFVVDMTIPLPYEETHKLALELREQERHAATATR